MRAVLIPVVGLPTLGRSVRGTQAYASDRPGTVQLACGCNMHVYPCGAHGTPVPT